LRIPQKRPNFEAKVEPDPPCRVGPVRDKLPVPGYNASGEASEVEGTAVMAVEATTEDPAMITTSRLLWRTVILVLAVSYMVIAGGVIGIVGATTVSLVALLGALASCIILAAYLLKTSRDLSQPHAPRRF
jgi:hypothetical protein